MLRVYRDALDVVGELVPYLEAIERRDVDLGRQLKKARSSMPLNIAEGSNARGGRRNLHYSFALGSGDECIAVLETAFASKYINELPLEIIEKLRKIIGTLHKCIHGSRK
jgi:four helix bundle protein